MLFFSESPIRFVIIDLFMLQQIFFFPASSGQNEGENTSDNQQCHQKKCLSDSARNVSRFFFDWFGRKDGVQFRSKQDQFNYRSQHLYQSIESYHVESTICATQQYSECENYIEKI